MPVKDLTGQKTGHLTVLEFYGQDEKRKGRSLWRCRCDCPDQTLVILPSDKVARNRTCGPTCEWNLTPKLKNLALTSLESPEGRDWVSFPVQLAGGATAPCVIDREDLDKLADYRWSTRKTGNITYARASIGGGKYAHVHRLVFGLGEGQVDKRVTDHYDGNGLHNTKRIKGVGNLQVVDQARNSQNKHRSKRTFPRGVSPLSNQPGKWQARVSCKGKAHYLGCFSTVEEAEQAAIKGRAMYFTNANETRKSENTA